MSFAASVLGRNLRSKVKQRSVATFWSAHPVQQEAEKIEKKVIRKTDLIKVVAEAHNLSQAESGRIVGTIFDTITDNLASKHNVVITNFGKFEAVTAKARVARNPLTQEEVKVPEKQRVKFSAMTELKAIVNGKKKENKE